METAFSVLGIGAFIAIAAAVIGLLYFFATRSTEKPRPLPPRSHGRQPWDVEAKTGRGNR